MRDCYYERDTGIGDFEVRDSGNNHLNEPRTGMSVDENEKHQVNRRADVQANENYIRSKVANLPKILNGPQGNEACQTAASVEMLNGTEKPPASLRIIHI